MSTQTERDSGAACRGRGSGKGAVTVAGVVIAVAYLVLFLARHDVFMAVFGPAVMIAYVVATRLLSGRWEAAAVLGGDLGDERRRAIDERAAALTLRVLAAVCTIGFFVSVARGSGAMVWAGIGAVLGGVYIGATIVLTRRG
ncbi:MAG: hypothetical protein HOW97_20680 [Catenulispora sp.]|nr:hypothetical protein [Catenulispora sp.]